MAPPKKKYNGRQWNKPVETSAGPPVKRISGKEAKALIDKGEITHIKDIADRADYIHHE